MGIERILEANTKTVDSALREFLPERINHKWLSGVFGAGSWDVRAVNASLSNPVWDLLGRGGKRWRPLLMFLSCSAVGGNPDGIRKFAVIPELIHTGSLIADDIEDSSLTRRGQPAIHVRYGTDVAVNLGSMLYFLPLTVLRSLNAAQKLKIHELISQELLKLHLGQGTDIHWHSHLKRITEQQYFAMCANKTGTLARLSAKMGAILGGGSEQQAAALGSFAESIGIAFQIQDDILNLQSSLGKDYGEDITEAKISFPLLRTLSLANPQDRRMLIGILKKHTKEKDEINAAIEIIRKHKALDYSEAVAAKIVERSWSRLEPLLPDTAAKKTLSELGRFMVARKH
ncbi:polyprenyl synthetase family protein [Candidatus Woesearchaeota archaeon]|nr:polyprenyl synthetase family protein [Candidatus Woesearchaeota archaeon]